MKKEVVEKIVERIMRQVLKNDYSQDVINSLGELYDLSREAYLPDEENLRARITFWPKRQDIESGGIQQVLNAVLKKLIFEINKKSDEKTLLQIARLYQAIEAVDPIKRTDKIVRNNRRVEFVCWLDQMLEMGTSNREVLRLINLLF